MPQIDLKYSTDLNFEFDKIFPQLEKTIHELDSASGPCKCRAYPAPSYYRTHVFLQIAVLKKPHRDHVFMEKLASNMEAVLRLFLPKKCQYSIALDFLSDYYMTS